MANSEDQLAPTTQIIHRFELKDNTPALVRQAELSDLVAILELEQSFDQSQRWSKASWVAELSHHILVVETTEVVAVAAFSVIDRVADLNRIIVNPKMRRLGIAAVLLGEGLKLMSTLATRTMLEVSADNLGAIALYQCHGFQVIGLRPNYYLGADAQVMEVTHV